MFSPMSVAVFEFFVSCEESEGSVLCVLPEASAKEEAEESEETEEEVPSVDSEEMSSQAAESSITELLADEVVVWFAADAGIVEKKTLALVRMPAARYRYLRFI